MQDPKNKVAPDVLPADFNFSEEAPETLPADFKAETDPLKKSQVGNESSQPLSQGTEGSAMPTTESTAVDFEAVKGTPTKEGMMLPEVDIVAAKDPYKVDGKKVKATDLTKMLYEPSFIDAIQSGKATVEFPKNDEAMKYLVERQKNAGSRKSDVWNSLKAGTEDMLAGVVGLDSYVANVMRSIPGLENAPKTPQEIVSELGADKLRMAAEKDREKIRAYEDGFINEVKSGNFGNAASMTFNTLAESVPFMVGVGATMSEGVLPMLATQIPINASKEFAKDDSKLTNREKVLRSTVYGGAEVVFGALPTIGIFNKNFGLGKQFVRDAVTRAFEVSGKEAAETVAFDVAKKTTIESLKALGIDVTIEVGGEMATTLTQMGVDDALGVTNYTAEDYQKQLLETAAISLAMTGVMTSPSIKRIVDSSIKSDNGATIKSAVFDAVEKGVLDAAQAKTVMDAIKPRVDAVNSLPADVAANTETVDTAAEIKRLEAKSEAADETGKAFIDPEINALRKEIAIPLPDKYVNTAGKNLSELKDGQLYITRKGDVRMWDAAQEQFLEAPRTTQVKLGTEVELEPTVSETKAVEPEPKQDSTPQPTKEVSPSSIDNGEAAVVETPTQTEVVAEEVVTPPTETVAKEPAPAPEATEQDFRTLREEEQAANQDEEIRELLIEEEAKIRRASERLQEMDALKGANAEDISDNKEAAIADHIGRVTEESFAMFDDRNNINDAIRKAYFTRKEDRSIFTLDQVAKDISDESGMEITTADVSEFIKKYPEGRGVPRTKNPNTYYGSNSPKLKQAELLADAEAILGYELDAEGMVNFEKQSVALRDAIAEIESKPISDADVDALNLEYEAYLKSLTDGQRKRELAKQRIEGEQIVEGAEDANLKAIKDRDAEAREAEEGIVPIVEQVAETIEDRIAKAKAALKERNAGKLRSGFDFENLDLYTELAYLYIRKGIKSAAEFAKELGEELSDAIKKAWDAANENYKAETENFDKWKAYAKKQFDAEDGGLEFQDFKARFNKKFNVAADDVALVEIFSEAQSEYKNEAKKPTTKRSEVDKSFKDKPKMITVDEAKARTQQIRLEVKAANEGAKSVTEAVKAIVKYVNEMSDRGNLTRADLTKIMNLIPNVKDQKTLDSAADKIYNIIEKADSDVIEVSERKALKSQLRLEVKAAKRGFAMGFGEGKKEGKTQIREERQSFADRIKAFLDSAEVKGKLSPTQAKSLINRASNIKTERGLDNFIDYAEKVIDNVNYDAEMKAVSDLQKRARRRNHVSFNGAVKEFATVNPESIPADRLSDYIEALNDLANGVPNYKKMQEMFYDITQFKKQPKPFDSIKTFEDADAALQKAMAAKIDTIADYKNLLKNIRAFNKRVNQLYDNGLAKLSGTVVTDGHITEQERNDLLDALAKDRKSFDEKFGADVDRLKTDLIKDALAVQSTQEYKDAVAAIKSPADKELMFEFSAIKPEALKRLPPEMLSDLADILQNVSDGFIDHFRLRDIISEANALRNAEAVARQVESKTPSVENVNAKLNELSKEEVAFREGELGLGKKKAGALTKYVYDPIISAIEKANRQTQLGVSELKTIFNKKDKNSRLRMGIVANMLQEYMAQYNPKFAKVENIGNRDWVKDVFDKKLQSRFKDEKEANEVLKAWESLVGGKIESGKSLSPKELYDSFIANDGKYLTKEEGAALAKWFKYAEEVNADKQKASNEMRGKEFNAQPFYAPRIRRDGDATIDDDAYDVAIDSKTNRISIKSPFGESRTSQEVEALNYDIVETAEKAISNANRDYELTKAMQEVNRTINAATNKKTSDVMSVVAKDVKESLVRQYGNTLKSDPIRKLQNLRSTLVQLNPLKTIKEFVSTVLSMPIRGGEPLGYLELFKAGGMKDILEFTGSPLAERLNVNQQFQLTEGEINSMSKMQKLAYYLGGSPEMTMMKTVYMPIFKDEFKAETGADFDIEKFRKDEQYRSDNLQAIKDANATASNEVQKIIGSGSRFGSRREIKVPFSGKTIPIFGKTIKNIDADTPTGQIVSFMGGYPYREQKEFWNGFKEVSERAKDGEGIGSLRSLRKPLAVSINMLAYAYMGQVVRTIAAQIKGEEEEKKQEKQLEEKFTPEGLAKTVIGQAINISAAKYGAIGSTISKSALAIAAYNAKDDATKKKIRDVAKENFYGLSPAIDKITGSNKYAANEAIKKYQADLIPALGVISEGVVNASGTVMDIADISKRVANGENVTDEEKELWQIANTGVNALHLLLMTMGGGLPSYYDIKAAVENKAKSEQKQQQSTPSTQPLPTRKTRPSKPE